MNKKEELIQLCESVIEKGGSVLDVSCNEIKCMDCPLSYVNRKDKKCCSYDRKATLEVAKNFLAEECKKSYSFEEIVLMNLKGGIEKRN